jgi:hypothetical protein
MAEENANTNVGDGNTPPAAVAVEATKVEDLPKWAQDELSRARNDAAGYRNRLKTAKDEVQAEVQKTFDDKVLALTNENTELKNKATDFDMSMLKLDTALEIGVPGEHLKAFAARLQGSTPDEIKADAEEVKKLFGTGTSRATDRSAGLGNQKPEDAPSAFADYVGKQLGWPK